MEYEIGYVVVSSEVPPRESEGESQEKLIEIIEFVDDKTVKCKYFIENHINPKVEYYTVSISSMILKRKTPLIYKGVDEDPFFNKFKK